MVILYKYFDLNSVNVTIYYTCQTRSGAVLVEVLYCEHVSHCNLSDLFQHMFLIIICWICSDICVNSKCDVGAVLTNMELMSQIPTQ
jgi:hypothetical protein